jgi:hypothetical protein
MFEQVQRADKYMDEVEKTRRGIVSDSRWKRRRILMTSVTVTLLSLVDIGLQAVAAGRNSVLTNVLFP